jgi:hypothetical protein
MTTNEYWKKIRAIAAEFDPEALQRDREEEEQVDRVHLRTSQKFAWLTSLDNPEKGSVGGQTVEARPYLAGERIFAQTHRKATQAEIDAELSRRAEARAGIEEAERIRKGNHAKDIGEAIASSILAGQAQQQKPSRRGAEPAG